MHLCNDINTFVGQHPLFTIPRQENNKILKNFPNLEDISIPKRANLAVESECCFLTILKDLTTDNMDIVAIIYSKYSRYVQFVVPEKPIVIFSCFDEVHLILKEKHSGGHNIGQNRLNIPICHTISESCVGCNCPTNEDRSHICKYLQNERENICQSIGYSVSKNSSEMEGGEKKNYYQGRLSSLCEVSTGRMSDLANSEQESACHSGIESYVKDDTSAIPIDSINCKLKTFYSVIQCCGKWGQSVVKAKLFDYSQGYTDVTIDIPISVTNKKLDGRCHLNICKSNKISETFSLLFNRSLLRLYKYQCPLCLVICSYMDFFIVHIKKYHFKYNISVDSNIVQIDEYDHDVLDSSENAFDFLPRLKLNSSASLSDNTLSEDRSRETTQFDFCHGISIETLEGADQEYSKEKHSSNSTVHTAGDLKDSRERSQEFRLNFDSLLESDFKDRLSQNRITFKKVQDPNDLVNQIASDKIQCNTSLTVYFIEPFRIKSAKKISSFSDEHRSFITVTDGIPELRDLSVNSPNDISFKKKQMDEQKIPIFDYPLFNSTLVIEEEYNKLDFTDLLSSHLNQRLDRDRRTNQISDTAHEIMTCWNSLMIRYRNIDLAVSELIKEKGMTPETLEVLALLYRRGLLNSSEIISFLN